ncbi:MAG: thermonuclease family protein [Treponema sp.]|jgi:micrococcal nuclease|nr:thermonuclease family protein [Treponema sp.]
MDIKNKPHLLIIIVLVFAATVIPTVRRTVYAESAAAGEKTTVYVTNSGGSYHREDCSALRRSRIAVTLADAVRSEYEPCSICKPPILSREDAPEAPETAGPSLYRVNRATDPGSGDEGLKSYTAADLSLMIRAEVVDHVDGDTVRVRIASNGAAIPAELGVIETIRLIGVDTPETVHPNRPVERFGKEASDFTRAQILNRQVYLAFDWDLRDHYGRLLAYIYLGNGECFNALLIREGYAYAYTRFAFQFMDEFRVLEQEARGEKRGLWGD